MNRPLTVVVALVTAFAVGIVAPTRAHAQELRLTSPASWITPDGSPEIRHRLAVAQMHAEALVPFQLDPPMKEVRLSEGAKTAIIVGAIIVGVLIIVGAVALTRPGKKLP